VEKRPTTEELLRDGAVKGYVNEEEINEIKKFLYVKIVVPENSEVKNGVLGLNEGCYLSLVKFLASSILREV
jgi:hypothetical protein